jgi:hypothetical protein
LKYGVVVAEVLALVVVCKDGQAEAEHTLIKQYVAQHWRVVNILSVLAVLLRQHVVVLVVLDVLAM